MNFQSAQPDFPAPASCFACWILCGMQQLQHVGKVREDSKGAHGQPTTLTLAPVVCVAWKKDP